MTPKLVVFDVAGTTVRDDDHAVQTALRDALAADGVELNLDQVNPLIGRPKPLGIAETLAVHDGRTPDPARVDRVHDDYQARIIRHYQMSPNVGPTDGTLALFATLRRLDCRIGLDTGFDRATLDVVLDRLNWHGIVDANVASDEVVHGRPHPEMIHELMRRTGVQDIAKVWKVGDSVSDLEQGLAAGCPRVFGVLSVRTRPVIARYPRVHPIASLCEIDDLLTNRGLTTLNPVV